MLFFRGKGRPSTRRVGKRGERAAARMLRRRGYRVLARNQRLHFGELDLVCLAPDRREVVFVEVKALHRGDGTGAGRFRPEDHVDRDKRRRLVALSRAWLGQRGWQSRHWRIDVVAVEFAVGVRRPTIRHHERAVP